ncbi:hypothetical protein [Runella sp.]|uniref:hypothetical protein n=1 Tax=Runella sp. TaxID=1960881 RepID=UPI003D0BEB5D
MLLRWIQFDQSPTYFWMAGHLFIGIFSVWLLLRQRPLQDWLFFTVVVVLTGLMRLPVFLFNYELDPDESQALTQGITLAVDPIIYQSVDPTTGGPLTSYLLAALAQLGFTLNFHLAHLVGWLLTLISLFLVYKSAIFLNLKTTVQWAMLPFIAFLSFIQLADFVSLYSEITCMILLSASLCFLARWSYVKAITIVELIVFGILLGLLPLCKIQVLPMAFVIGVFAFFQIFLFRKTKAIRYGAILAGSVLSVWAGWSLFLWKNKVLDDFILFYIKANFQYTDALAATNTRSPLLNFFRLPWVIIRGGSGFEWLFLPFCLVTFLFVLFSFYRKKGIRLLSTDSYFWAMILAYLVMADVAITRTGSFYDHYDHFLLLPFLLLMSLFLKHLPSWGKWFVLSTQICFLIVLLQKTMLDQPTNTYTYLPRKEDVSNKKVADTILKYGQKGDYLAVWGWSCSFYVLTQMPQAVNENHTTRSALAQPLQPVYLQRYLNDLKRTQPPVFVDAVGEKAIWISDRTKYGHERFPTLAKYISDNYTLKEELEDVRIYARNKKGNPGH